MGRGCHWSRPVGRDGGPRSRGGRHTRPPRRAARLSPREGLRGLSQRTGPGRTEDRRPRDVGRTVGSHAIAIVPAGRARVRGQTRPTGGHGGHSRARFDAALVGAAVAAGAHFLPRTEAGVGAVEGSARLVHLGCSGNARTIRAKVVLAATGLGHSCLPKGAAPRTRIAPGSSIGAGCFLLDGPSEYEAGTIHMAVGKDGYVGLVRLRDGSLHLAAALRPGALRKAGGPGEAASVLLAAAGFPAIDGLASARWQGTPALTRRTRPLADTRVFVVGDAAGYVEPFTGEGIAWALSSGRTIATLAFRAVERWEPRLIGEWEILHHRVVRRRQTLCRAASLVLRRPLLARAACELMSRLPGSTRRIVALLNAPSPSMEAS